MGTFIVHWLINEQDKKAVESAASSLNKSMLSFLPTMGAGEALLIGVDFSMPLLLKITPPFKTPRSETPILNKKWLWGVIKGVNHVTRWFTPLLRRERDSNPRNGQAVHRISSPAQSVTLASLLRAGMPFVCEESINRATKVTNSE